ncbi:hypothetical protein LTR35_017792 [Friedmanniomyces endolithicus]|nr:hypothetical protein LTR35_017792 [Friedmanniomyces endolithicus]KAK0268150.1 hypothetical protein LTS00_017640 [Friedmanniomyces endolithicus]
MRTLVIMIERGQFYETLGTDLGGGACLALGTSLPETHWTKLMTRTTNKRGRVIEHLTTNTQVPELAVRYQALQERLITHKVESILVERSLFLGEVHDSFADWTMPNTQDGVPHDFSDATMDEILGADTL